MPDSTVDSASSTAPPTTTSPDSDDEFFKPANVTTGYKAEHTPLGTITCSKEVDGTIKNIHVVRTHSHAATDCDAFLIVRDNSLRGDPTWLAEEIRWKDPSAASTLMPSQGLPVTEVKRDKNGKFLSAIRLTNMTVIPKPPSHILPPGSENNKAYRCTITQTIEPASASGPETVNWESSRVGSWMTQPGEWQDTPPLDSSSASRARYSNNHARSPSTS